MYEEERGQKSENFMVKLATVIVDKRNLVFLIFGILLVFSLFSRNWVAVENDLTTYLPATSETKQGLDIMAEEFTTFGSADLMIANLTYRDAQKIATDIEQMTGVQSVGFDDSTEHYNNTAAMYSITFDYPEDDQRCLDALAQVQTKYASYDTYLKTSLGNQTGDIIHREINLIMVFVAIIVLAVLTFTSQTYAEIPVLLLTFGSAMILNLGSNFLLGKISFVSNSVTSILQLALSLDYAVILCNRFKEEHKTLPIHEATIQALSKGIPEIGASSLTTIGGLVAMLFMNFKIGPDMAINLIKAILFALFSVFVLMPGLLVLFGPLMDKTEHKNFVPQIPFVGKFAFASRMIVPAVFTVFLVGAFFLSKKCPYVYGYDTIETPKLNEIQIGEQMIRDNFTSTNLVALVVPAGDYESEKAILSKLETMPQVDHAQGLSNTEAMDGYMLTDKLTPRQFAELADLDYEEAEFVYAAYAAENEDYAQIVGNIANFRVPLIDMFLFAVKEVNEGYVTLDADVEDKLNDAAEKMENGRLQLEGTNYSRMLVYLNLPVSGEETYSFTDLIKEIASDYYPDQPIYVVGDSTNEYEFQKSFGRDNMVVSIMSILIVLMVLLFTFKSVGLPILLILVIQGAIWMNFTIPVFTHKDLFFLGFLIVSAIQMGANIDYAIVIASRFSELKEEMSHRDAIIETMNFAFPTIITSGSILAISGILIGQMTSDGCIVGIGQALGRGTIISIILVMFVLPQILLLGDVIVEKTSFSVKRPVKKHLGQGRMIVDGVVRGTINGTVTGTVHATVEGDVNVVLVSGTVREATDDEESAPQSPVQSAHKVTAVPVIEEKPAPAPEPVVTEEPEPVVEEPIYEEPKTVEEPEASYEEPEEIPEIIEEIPEEVFEEIPEVVFEEIEEEAPEVIEVVPEEIPAEVPEKTTSDEKEEKAAALKAEKAEKAAAAKAAKAEKAAKAKAEREERIAAMEAQKAAKSREAAIANLEKRRKAAEEKAEREKRLAALKAEKAEKAAEAKAAKAEKAAKAKAERDERIAAMEAQKAEKAEKAAAERAEREKKAAAERAERAKQAAADRAEREKKAAALKAEREKQAAELKAEKERKAAAAKKAKETYKAPSRKPKKNQDDADASLSGWGDIFKDKED